MIDQPVSEDMRPLEQMRGMAKGVPGTTAATTFRRFV
jgi:hypothetical protein